MSTRDVWLNVKHLATFLYQGFIEVDEKSPLLLIEGTEIVLQIFKEGRINSSPKRTNAAVASRCVC